MANGRENIEANKIRSTEEARKRGRNGGKASGEARRRKRDLRERAKMIMEQAADPRVANAMKKTGIEVTDNADVVLAGIYKGVIKGEPKSINMWLELTGDSIKEQDRREIKALEKRKAELEAERAEMENELYRMRLDAIKGIGQDNVPDDGFLEALSGTAEEDWSDESI